MRKLLLLLTLFTFCRLQAQVLNVKQMIQEQDQWCWAAASACVLDYYCTPVLQCVIANYTRTVATWHDFGTADCCTNPSGKCNYWNYNWGYNGSILDILKQFGNINNSGVSSSLSKTSVASDIMNNRLFIIRWQWSNGGGHFLVGHGLVDNTMYYMDPWFGEGLKIADYSWVVSGGNHTWTHTNRITTTPPNSKPLAPGAITGPANICKGQDSVTYSVPVLGNASSYLWSLPYGATGTSTTNNIKVFYGPAAMSGTITVRGNNTCGEGTASSLTVSVNNKPGTPVVTFQNNVLHSNAPSGNQWYNQSGIIDGAVGQDYTPTADGDYYVIVTLQGCSSDPSAPINVKITGIETTLQKNIKIYPNPVTDELTIEIDDQNNTLAFEILNLAGSVIHRGVVTGKTTIKTDGFPPGVFFIRLENGRMYEMKKLIKGTVRQIRP